MKQAKIWLGRVWRNLNRRLSRLYIARRVRGDGADLVRLGSAAGGWRVPRAAPAGAVAYCGGVGLDATFDFALRETLAMEVHAFDPTPKAVAYMETANQAGVGFHPWGLSDHDGVIRFYAPVSESHQSWFTENLHHSDTSLELPCRRIATIMKDLGHDSLYLLKIDIEGAWWQVIPDMLASGVRPVVVDVEFDSPAPLWRVMRVTGLLERAGYRVAFQEKDNVTFLRDADARPAA